MSWRASATRAALVVALAVLSTASGSVWGAFSASTVSPGNSIVAAADWVAPQVDDARPRHAVARGGVAQRDRDRRRRRCRR